VLGFFSFTEVTDPSAHRAYNEWHRLDHLPEQFSLDGILFGQRWVATPSCREARVAVSPLLQPCHYMTLYLMRDPDVLPGFFVVGPPLDGAAMVAHEGVAGAWSFGDAERTITVAFIDGDLASAARELGRWCLERRAAAPQAMEWAGPLAGVDTDSYDWFDRLTPT